MFLFIIKISLFASHSFFILLCKHQSLGSVNRYSFHSYCCLPPFWAQAGRDKSIDRSPLPWSVFADRPEWAGPRPQRGCQFQDHCNTAAPKRWEMLLARITDSSDNDGVEKESGIFPRQTLQLSVECEHMHVWIRTISFLDQTGHSTCHRTTVLCRDCDWQHTGMEWG